MQVRGGWNITGDTYVREPDGYFRFVARADDMIVSAGYDIAGPEVEDALREFVRAEPAPYQCPREIVFRTSLPRTATGKLQRFRLLTGAETGGDRQ